MWKNLFNYLENLYICTAIEQSIFFFNLNLKKYIKDTISPDKPINLASIPYCSLAVMEVQSCSFLCSCGTA